MEEKRKSLKFKLSFEGTPEKGTAISGYAFDRKGKFLAKAPLSNGQISLNLSPGQARDARIFFGPAIEGKRSAEPTLKSMEMIHAYEPSWVYDPKKLMYEILPIPEPYFMFWIWRKCRVKGKVVKTIMKDGISHDMPVQHARVHICEVDPLYFIIPYLPDLLVFRLRDEFLKVIEKPFPRPPLPDPPPFRLDPEIIDPRPEILAELNREAEAKVFKGNFRNISGIPTNPQPGPPEAPMPKPFIPMEIQSGPELMSASAEVVKKALISNVKLMTPFLCWWPWLWPFYRCDEIAVVETDQYGRFETSIWYLIFGDHPDLYFWVEYCIGGTWETVYNPSIRCHTYWNYLCGSLVTIHLTDPRVPWVEEPPSLPTLQVGIMTIGNKISLHEIQGQSSGASEGLTTLGEPLGGRLEPHVWFGEDLIVNGVTHYKWSYRKIKHANGSTASDSWHAVDRQVVRHYAVIDPNPPYSLTFKPFLLGPDPVFPTQSLFKIQPKNSPAGSSGWAPQIDARENSASAFFLSHLLNGGDAITAAGKYELKLELFDSGGNLINITDKGILFKVPTIDAPFGPVTVPTTDPANEYLIKNTSGKTVAFKLVVHVDNNPCEATIYEASVNSNAAGPCGFISYPPGSSAHLSFRAYHRNHFARFRFTLVKGSAGYKSVACAPANVSTPWNTMPLVSDTPVNGYIKGTNSIFSKDIPVTSLVGSCPGGKASFAENLYVWALATDGWNRLNYLDKSAVPKAFALEPGPIAETAPSEEAPST